MEAAGLAAMWMPQLFDVDALTALAVIGREVGRIDFGTSVVPTYPRHPLMLAGQALTTQAATGNRLTLGIGLSHQMVIEGVFGYSFEKPARHMREYLSILMPALAGEKVSFQGETLKATTMGPLAVAGAAKPDVLVAALGPHMLKLAGAARRRNGHLDGRPEDARRPHRPFDHSSGRRAPGGGRHASPSACRSASPPTPTRLGPGPAKTFAMYGQLPSYRAMLDREGVTDPADVAIIGDEDTVASAAPALDRPRGDRADLAARRLVGRTGPVGGPARPSWPERADRRAGGHLRPWRDRDARAPRPGTEQGRDPRAGAGRRPQQRRPDAAARGGYAAPAWVARRHPRPRAGRRGDRHRARRRALRRRGPGHGPRRRRRPGRAGRRPRAPGHAGAQPRSPGRRRAGCPRCSPPPTTPCSPRPAWPAGTGSACTAAAGGVGTAGVQLAVVAGATVTATVRNPDLRDAVAGLGATVIAPEEAAGHGPYDIILELIGGPNLAARPRGPGHRRAHHRHRPRRGRPGRGQPGHAHGQAGPHHGIHPPGPAPRGQGHRGQGRRGPRAAVISNPAGSSSRSPPPSP